MEPTSIVQPDIYIFGLRIMEPVTSATDVFIAFVCFYGFWVLNKKESPSQTVLYMKWYFLIMGIGGFFGGVTGHAFLYALDNSWKLLGWIISMLSIMLVERAAIQHARRHFKPIVGKVLMIFNIIELAILMTLCIMTVNFKFVQIHAFYGYVGIVLGFHSFVYYKTRDKSSLYIFYAIASLFFSIYIFNKPVVLHEWFNHRDFAHMFMAFASYMLLLSTLNLNNTPDRAIQ